MRWDEVNQKNALVYIFFNKSKHPILGYLGMKQFTFFQGIVSKY
jgi:hypothetical protein